jgi:predicted HTH transcriptional regulator
MSDDPTEEPASAEKPADQAFVDGRTDYEKLVELLAFPEGTHLDFKAELDLGSTESKLKFVKDVVAMSNTPPGGYLLIGVEDDGKLCLPVGTIDRSSFDGARLGDLVRPYIEGRVNLRVAIHEHLSREVVVILVLSHVDGLPVPMGKAGNHHDPANPKRQINIFRQGEVPVREGPANVPLRHTHWRQILSTYTRQVRAEGTELAQNLLREFIEERGQSRSESAGNAAVPVPLLVDMNESTFASTMQAMLDAKDDMRLRRFLRKLGKS